MTCGCGCGGMTPLACRTDTPKGWVKGQPLRFLRFHQVRLKWKPEVRRYRHVRTGNGYLQRLHRLRAEQALGKPTYWYAAKDGTYVTIDELLVRADQWEAAIQAFTSAASDALKDR